MKPGDIAVFGIKIIRRQRQFGIVLVHDLSSGVVPHCNWDGLGDEVPKDVPKRPTDLELHLGISWFQVP